MISTKSIPQIYSTKKPCCKVCQDAGKPENVYLSHYVKDLNGNVTCPTLLSQECRYCHKKGHTTSHCSVLKKQKEAEENLKKPPLSPPVKKNQKSEKKANVFAYLDLNSDNESESDNEQEEVNDFPELVAVAAEPKDVLEKTQTSEKKFSYASMAAKTIADYKIEQLKIQLNSSNLTPYVDKKPEVKVKKVWPALAPGQKKSWAQIEDESSSDEEDEEFDEENSAW
jgi:hypothetical protein